MDSVGDFSAVSSIKSVPQLVPTTDHGDHSGSCSADEGFAFDSEDEFFNESLHEASSHSRIIQNNIKDCIEEELFETLDQNQFLIECFMSNERSDVTFLVHFFNEDSAISDEIEEHVSRMVQDQASKCQCRRVNARLAPLFTAKLGIDPEQPTIVSILNGKVLAKLTDISSSVCFEIEEWIMENDILNQLEMGSFSNLSTDF